MTRKSIHRRQRDRAGTQAPPPPKPIRKPPPEFVKAQPPPVTVPMARPNILAMHVRYALQHQQKTKAE